MFYSIVKFLQEQRCSARQVHTLDKSGSDLDGDPDPYPYRDGGAFHQSAAADGGHNRIRYGRQVTGYQWGWHYDYMEDDVDFFSKLTTPQSQITGSETKVRITLWRSITIW